MLEAQKLCLWAESHVLSLRADHISRTAKVQVDWLSQTTGSHRVATPPRLIPQSDAQVLFPNSGSVRASSQHAPASILQQVPDPRGGRSQRPTQSLASGTAVRISTTPAHSEVDLQDPGGGGRGVASASPPPTGHAAPGSPTWSASPSLHPGGYWTTE